MNHDNHPPSPDPQHDTLTPLIGIPFNLDDYRHHFDGMDLTLEQQDELLHILYDIMRQFVDWGFNLHPIQAAQSDGKCSIDVVALIEHWAEAPQEEETE